MSQDKAAETRKLYQFEHAFKHKWFARRPRSERYLRALAAEVWAKHGRAGISTPIVVVIDGAQYSWCEGYSRINLATKTATDRNLAHNTIEVLLHELTHAIGYVRHGRRFLRKYIELLVEYAGADADELKLAMSLFNLKA